MVTVDRDIVDPRRLEALADGVFAFSATLLVVSLEVPDSLDELRLNLWGFVGFGVSFAALLAIWRVHASFSRRHPIADRITVLLTGVFLFTVLFYVYPLKFLADAFFARFLPAEAALRGARITRFDDLRDVFMIYSAGFMLLFLSVALLYWRAASRCADRAARQTAQFWSRHYGIFVLVALVSLLLAAGDVGIRIAMPGWIYGLIGPLAWVHGAWSARAVRGDAAAG